MAGCFERCSAQCWSLDWYQKTEPVISWFAHSCSKRGVCDWEIRQAWASMCRHCVVLCCVVLCSVVRALTLRPTSQLWRPVSSSPANVIPNREVARIRMDNGNMRGPEGGGCKLLGTAHRWLTFIFVTRFVFCDHKPTSTFSEFGWEGEM